jgi:hypothetical protein
VLSPSLLPLPAGRLRQADGTQYPSQPVARTRSDQKNAHQAGVSVFLVNALIGERFLMLGLALLGNNLAGAMQERSIGGLTT